MPRAPVGEYLVIADYATEPDRFDEVWRLVGQLAEASRSEPGNLRYDVLTTGNRRRITIVESYRTAADFTAHRESAHFESIGVARIIPLLTSRTVRAYAPVES